MAKRDDDQLPSRRLAALLRTEIEGAGRYAAGERLPSYRQLAAEHGVAVNTASAAVQLLANEGLVEIRAASGAYVCTPAASDGSERADLRTELVKLQEHLGEARAELDTAEQIARDLLKRLPPDEAPH
ncbi:winged helix-turn-helix domain-containing protein [Actinomadura sp. NPDC023710]|uniref:winged helix-turn-helix domain-containing protein n=1 Tax=Actinomadura sp. NPDC023710 TaxID=3158219 RepID=UPI0034023BBD